MFNTTVGAGAAGAASHYGSGSDQKMRLRLRNTEIKFSRKLQQKFRTFAKIFLRKLKFKFCKNFSEKKTKSKTLVLTISKFVAKPHLFHAAPTPSHYF
jgi:hypothetical protein